MYELSGLPASVKVGPYRYQLIVIDPLHSMGDQVWGSCCNMRQVIELQRNWPDPARAVDTVIHEIMHAMASVANIPEQTDEETTVAMMSTNLIGVFVDNPRLLEWVQDTLNPHLEI